MNGLNLDEKTLLNQYRQAKDTEIERLLSQYGTSLKDVREMYPQLTGAIEQRKLTTAFPTQPLFFTAMEAQQMGLGLQEGWMLKMSPGKNGDYSSSLVSPEKWEITEDDFYISPAGEKYNRADLEALLGVPTGGLEAAPQALAIEDLTEEGQSLYQEYQGAGGELDVPGWLDLRERQQLETEEVFGAVFPEQDLQEVIDYINTSPEGFLADLREIGWTADTEALLRNIIPEITEADLQEIFATTIAPEFKPEGFFKDYVQDPLTLGKSIFGDIWTAFTTIFPSVFESMAANIAKFFAIPITAPIGGSAYILSDILGEPQKELLNIVPKTIEETVPWLTNIFLPKLQEKCERDFLRRMEENDAWLQEHPELTPNPAYLENPFEHTELFRDLGYYIYSISSSLVYSLTTMGTIVAVSAVATPVGGITAGLIVAGAPEATSMTEELVRQGIPFEEAAQWGILYGLTSGGIETASDLPFLGLVFKPIKTAVQPMWNTIFKGVASRLAKRILTGVIITQGEALEEVITQVAHNAILKHYDSMQSILEGVSQAYIQATIASLPFGAIGGYASFNTFYDKLSSDMQGKFNNLVADGIKNGLTKQQAQVYATNELAKVPANEEELTQAIEAAQEGYWAEHGPAPAPVIPEMAEDVLKEIEVMGEVPEAVKPTVPTAEVTPTEAQPAETQREKLMLRNEIQNITRLINEIQAKLSETTNITERQKLLDQLIPLARKRRNLYRRAQNVGHLVMDGPEGLYITEGMELSSDRSEVPAPIYKLTDEEAAEYRRLETLPNKERYAGQTKLIDSILDREGLSREKVEAPTAEAGMPEAGIQPSMLEEVPAKEVRPAPKAGFVQARLDDYLKLREYNAKAATDRIAEIKGLLEQKGRLPKGLGLKGNLRLELARLEALQEVDAAKNIGDLNSLIKEVQAELSNRELPYHGGARNLFKGYSIRQLEEMLNVYNQARQTLSPEVPVTSAIKAEDIPTDIPALTNVALTPNQVQKTIELFKEAVAAPNTEMQRAAALELRKHVFAQRAKLASESAQAMIAEGMNPEEAIKAAEQQFMAGKLPDVTTDYFNDLTQEMRNVLFAKVYNYWKGKSWTELISTFEALTNALAGKSIPRVKGIGTKYFPDGGSAWDRLARVFIGDMEVLEALDQGKSLPVIIEGIYLEVGRGAVPLNQETVNWLKELSTISDEDRLLLEKPLSEITEAEVRRIAQSWFYQRRDELNTLLKDGVISQEEYKLQLAIAKDRVFPYKPIAPVVSYPEGMNEQLPLLTFREKGTIVRTLKNIGLTIIDIGNLIRANKASFDFSFWRQARALAAGHPVAFYRANIEAWKALWSQASAEAHWQRITRDPDFELYEEVRAKTGADPLRIFEAPKGTAQWRAAEEMGYLTGERPIPRFTARIPWIKVSGRSFVVGCNDIVWSIWKQCLAATRARAMRIASGDIKLEEGEGFSISEEMAGYQKYIADAIQRASLGKASPLAPALGSMFFAPRSKLARLLYPRHLISSNPRVRALAWKDFSLFIGAMSGLVMLGYWLGLWNVERDPRNAEFMSIRIGNMRIDPWAGHRQFIVLYSRLITGTGISSVTGQEYEVNPTGALQTFFRTSLAPLTSILWDSWTGKNFLGEEVDIANPKQWMERIAPFAIQDILEAFQDDWQNGLIAILPAIVGEGVQTYTGDWKENWAKIGLPKYLENTGYGIYEPVYDLADFWADTASQLRGVDPAGLTESKGYPEYVRSIAEALGIIEEIELLPNKRLASLNADPEEGTTFMQYYQMWQERQKIVASGDEEALKAFDADERTRNAYLGNMAQAQYALLMEYHSLPESQKAEFLGNHPELYANPREDWLRSHPEENALLALWGKAKIYSPEALGKVSSLAQSLGIPEGAMVARDLDVVTQLRLQHKALFDLLDAYSGLDDTIKDAEGLTAHDRAVQELYTNNPDFREDMRRIEALSEGTEESPTPEDIVEAWVDRGIIVDEFGASSAEAKLWLIDNKEVQQWALDKALLTDDGTDWNEPILRLLVQYRDDFDLYEGYGDMTSDNYISNDKQRADARHSLLFNGQGMTSFGKAYYTREASSQGYTESNWNAYVEYSALPIWGSWRERFLLDNSSFYKEYTDTNIGNHPLVDKTKVRPLNRDRIYQQFYDEFQSWDETGGMAPKAIENMRDELDTIERGGLTFKEARYSVQAYDNGFPENLIDAYVEWYSVDRKDYEDDWWLMEHKEFYDTMFKLEIWTEPRDFSKVPTREVYALYQTYLGLPTGNPRYDFRAKHPDLDDWLVLKFGYKPIQDRGSAEAGPTPWEELEAVKRFKEQF